MGALAGGLGCFPLEHEAYPPCSNSSGSPRGIRSLPEFGNPRRPLAQAVLYPRASARKAHPQVVSGRTSYLRVRLAFHPYPQLIRWFFNTNLVRASTRSYPRFTLAMGRSPGFGSTACNWRPVRTRFPYGSGPAALNLAADGHSPAHSSIGTPSGLAPLRLTVGTRFQVLFHSPPGVLFTFPSRYWCTIGRSGI